MEDPRQDVAPEHVRSEEICAVLARPLERARHHREGILREHVRRAERHRQDQEDDQQTDRSGPASEESAKKALETRSARHVSSIRGSSTAYSTSTTRLTAITSTELMNRMPSSRLKSRCCTASNASRPSPGQPNTLSTRTDPPSSEPTCTPTIVTSGSSAFLKTCP